ncbi:MAG TPA: alpha/beta fold hydrolase [Ideonella sp.]|uniref:alpha/beta fold hydrolase n=1 Tax=Ideonella sp. TaxID=1929293 RepID=UPI002E356A93|nr:alpha/beta fold hydrolase [Ideonella sp.]HEX5683277.1 alpha/beta fold hydrolase [Ideonella sp.]
MNSNTSAKADVAEGGAPSWLLLGAEPLRAVCELASAQFMNKSALPPGDGHPVVLFPGLASDARALAPLKGLCEGLGYTAHDWGRGFNTGPEGDIDDWLDALVQDVVSQVGHADERISLIGWSLGGIYAREVGKKLGTRRARRVITIGTPFAGTVQQTHAGLVYRLLNGSKAQLEPNTMRRLATPPEVPTTSIYSRSDGVVSWQACIQPGRYRHVENIEVSGSHCGLGWNTEVFAIVASRLARR